MAIAEPINLIDELLSDQKTLTAVERFSQKHESAKLPVQEPHYKDLIPIRKPSTGEQYSFAVDLDQCTGCKACVVACHSRNGLDEDESWRDVGEIRSKSGAELQTVTSACHHCADPGCMTGCPVGAYEKMEDTGIVRHLDDQCIGCEYCSLKCPYDVPKYNKDLGIVRKCDMCHDRLAEGEAPACVQSCPNGAIKIELVAKEEIFDRAKEKKRIIAGAYDSDYTYPSTIFRSTRSLPDDMQAVDEQSIEASHKHTPLSWMLMLTQVSVGVSIVALLGRFMSAEWSAVVEMPLLIVAVILGKVGLGASLFHLGSPLGAWRVFLGLKTSWLSREIVMFGAWMPALLAYLGALVIFKSGPLVMIAGLSSVLLGLVSVYCSIMVYADTRRAFWSFDKTTARFMGTVFVGGASIGFVLSCSLTGGAPALLWLATLAAWIGKAIVEGRSLLPGRDTEWSTQKKSALIQLVTLKDTLMMRWGLFAALVVFSIAGVLHPAFGVLAVAALIWGEWLERQLFFQAVETLKMPGNLKR